MSPIGGEPPRAESLAQLAGHVAHDIVNTLMIVLTYADRLSREIDPHDRAQDDVREIRAAAERAVGLTRQLLTCARRRASQQMVLDLHELLASLEAPIRSIGGESVRVEMSLDATRVSVLGDRGDLEQTLLNLVVNARDAMPQGGVLTIATSDSTGAEEPSGRYVEVLVRDTGMGMDEPTRGRIFEPFFTTKSPSVGTGLGLSLVAGVVSAMGGSIAVESASGQGATFRVSLPIAPAGT